MLILIMIINLILTLGQVREGPQDGGQGRRRQPLQDDRRLHLHRDEEHAGEGRDQGHEPPGWLPGGDLRLYLYTVNIKQ